jgi:hypothetical protein
MGRACDDATSARATKEEDAVSITAVEIRVVCELGCGE